MSHVTRRGFTLVELLIALVLLGVVSAAVYRVLIQNSNINKAQTQYIDLQQNLRAAGTILPAEFRELDASDGDIQAMSATSIRIRAMRYLGFVCQAPVTGVGTNGLTFMIRQQPWYGSRVISTSTDTLLVRYEGDEGTRSDDNWILVRPTSVSNGTCPAAAGSGASYQVTGNFGLGGAGQPANLAGAVYNGAPVRGFEVVTYSIYQPSGSSDYYLGITTASGTQPLVGPLMANGLSFAYLDSTGTVTASRDRVARIDIVVRGESQVPIRSVSGGTSGLNRLVDSVVTSVALRNNRRY